jgi:hypothetical protein
MTGGVRMARETASRSGEVEQAWEIGVAEEEVRRWRACAGVSM